jgi:anti-sigma factor RsiW
MKCSDCVELIARKLDGLLTVQETQELEAHLSGCARCRAELALQKKLVGALKRQMPGSLPGDFTRQVTARAAALAAKEGRRRFRVSDLLPALPIAAAALLLVIFRGQVAGFLTPAMESVADVIGGPLSELGNRAAEALAGSPAVTDTYLPGSELLPRIFANLYVGVAIACTALVWAFSKAYGFVNK